MRQVEGTVGNTIPIKFFENFMQSKDSFKDLRRADPVPVNVTVNIVLLMFRTYLLEDLVGEL